MGLITKEVEVNFSGSNYKHYENLGYKFETHIDNQGRVKRYRNSKIKVKVFDLSRGSNAKVLCTCDNCGVEKHMAYHRYVTESEKHDGKIYCHSCVHKLFNSGENCHLWKMDKTDNERYKDRTLLKYREFINKVLARDNYACQCCGYTDDLKVHHLDGYNWYVEGRYDENNGITLCGACHNNFHSIYGYGDNTKKQFEEWIGHTIENKIDKNVDYKIAKNIINLDTGEINIASIFSKKYNIQDTQIYKCCNREARHAKNFHFLYYEDYISMTKKEIDTYLEWTKCNSITKKIICITTGKIFYSLPEIEKEYPLCNKKAVWHCLNNNGIKSGKLEDGTPLQWMYYDDYLQKNKNGEDISIRENSHYRKVICTTTGIKFNRVVDGGIKYGLKSPIGISLVCKGKQNYAGKLSDGTPLKWMYYEDFLKLPQEEQNEILSRNQESSSDGSFIM